MLQAACADRRTFDDPMLSVSEIDHRIANNLALISALVRMRASGAASATPAEAVRMLNETASQVDAVAHLHRLLAHHPGASVVSIPEFLADICNALSRTIAAASAMSLTHAFGRGLTMERNRALPIALIVSEVVANAAKYAHPTGVAGVIHVDCRRHRGNLRIVVTDDGVGLPVGFDAARDGGLGFRVIRALTRQINAHSTFDSPGIGVRFTLDAPMAG